LSKFTLKTMFGLTGKMNEHDAGKVGNKLADTARILVVFIGLSIFIYAVRWW